MKRLLQICFFFLTTPIVQAQITSPSIKANFGVDADLRSNYFNNTTSFFTDDWFKYNNYGNDVFIIDTTGAAAIVARYNVDAAFRRQPFFRKMAFPQFSVVNNRLFMDAIFVREYHGDDSTVFASGSNKNAMSPANWSCPVSQQIPDKNDILDLFVHMRRAGSSSSDSLWLFGGISIENTTGNRYFDFEMFQTDITYNRSTQTFSNYGNDAGHTAWQFDAAGNIIRAGDIIFTAEYGSSSLSFIEARIWIDRADLSKTPAAFNWSGQFDGATSSSQYGYASIQPKASGAYYSGLQSADNVWAGPFALVREDNSVVTNYMARQFMEFSVNLSKLGLDPINLNGGSVCNMPFRRIMVKTRASTSFTAELKDFVAPFDLFQVPAVQALADVPLFCGSYNISNITVMNPVTSSIYTWSTTDGNIVGSTTGTTVTVDRPGMYIVTQQLLSNCGSYAKDTIFIYSDPVCEVLETDGINFKAQVENETTAKLGWNIPLNSQALYFEVERSTDGKIFNVVNKINIGQLKGLSDYSFQDDIAKLNTVTVFYRLKIVAENSIKYSKIIKLDFSKDQPIEVKAFPNPAERYLTVAVTSSKNGEAKITISNIYGVLMYNSEIKLKKGDNRYTINNITNWPAGTYFLNVTSGAEIRQQKIVISRNTASTTVFK